MTLTSVESVSYSLDGAAAATGYSRDVIVRAVRAGDVPVHYPEVDGKALAKPTIDADDLRAWVRRGKAERKAS